MNKKVKAIIISSVALVSAFTIATGVFFCAYPMTPKVEIKSADERVNNNEKLIVASYNTAAPWGNLLEGTYTTRRAHLFAQQINNAIPDVLGVQEMNSFWVERMKKLLPQYDYYGVKRGGDKNEKESEMSGIFYLKDKFELLESETFWISLTPEVESKYEGAACHRVCSYVVLKNKATGYTFLHMNTHLDHVSEEAQNYGGMLIAEKADKLKEKYGEIPTIITGDFNQFSDGASCKALESKGFFNANKTIENGDSLTTYISWAANENNRPIDFIFVNDKLTVNNYSVINETGTKTLISDHYMITAELGI